MVKPHIQGAFQVIEYPSGRAIPNAFQTRLSNHIIGSRELRLSATADYNGSRRQDIALPSLDRRSLHVVGFQGGKMRLLATAQLPGFIDKAIGVEGSGNRTVFTVGTEDGKVYKVSR